MTGAEQLALYGGAPAVPEGPPSWPVADDDVRAALEAAYADGSWGRYEGRHCRRLASLLAEMHGAPYVLLCSSGTVAVELALRGLQVSAGDEVILAGYDFSGNFRSIEAVGARPVLVDIEPRTWRLDAEQIEGSLSANTRAILVSHLHGGLAPMAKICRLAAQRGLAVVEDACQAPGAVVEGRPAGAWGDVGVLSFGGGKLLTAGRGGAILTRHAAVHQRIKIYCERGNHAFPLSELQAAVLPPQLEKLAGRNRRRRESVGRLLRGCADLPGLRPLVNKASDSEPSYYKLAWLYHSQNCGDRPRGQFIAALQAEGVAIGAGFRGFARRSQRRCRKAGPLLHSQCAADSTVVLHHPVLLEADEVIDRVAAAIRKVLAKLANCS